MQDPVGNFMVAQPGRLILRWYNIPVSPCIALKSEGMEPAEPGSRQIKQYRKDNNHPARFYLKMETKGKREMTWPDYRYTARSGWIGITSRERHWTSSAGVTRDLAQFQRLQKTEVLEEFRDSIRSLEESLAIDNPAIFIDHSCWSKVHLTALHYPKNHVSRILDFLGEVLEKELPPDFRKQAGAFIAECLAVLKKTSTDLPSCITDDNPHADVARPFLAALIAADQDKAGMVLEHAVRSGTP